MKTITFLIQDLLFFRKGMLLAVALAIVCTAPSVGFSTMMKSSAPASNHPPTISVKLADFYCVGDFVEIQLKGKDQDGDVLRYFGEGSGDPLPDGLSLDRITGLISGTLALNPGAGSSTNYEVHLKVFDFPAGASAETVINIFVVGTCSAHVSGFSLIDVASNTSLGPLNEGDILDLSILPAQLSVRANVSSTSEPVESVVFAFNGNTNFRTENLQPYSLAGDINGKFSKINFPLGSNRLMATPFLLNGGKGQSGVSKTINFKIVRSPGNHPPQLNATTKDVYCRGDRLEIPIIGKDPDGDLLKYSLDPMSESLPDNLSLNPNTGLISGLLVRTNYEGTSTNYDILVKATDPKGLSTKILLNIFSIDCGLRVSGFTLLDAFSQKDIRRLKEGDVLELAKLPATLSIRADVYPGEMVKSVVFDFNSKENFQTENQAPYALGGDNNGIYKPVVFLPGINTIKATPFYGISAREGCDESFTIQIKVIPPTLPVIATSMSAYQDVRTGVLPDNFKGDKVFVYPNPFTSKLTMQVFSAESKALTTKLYNNVGQLIYTQLIQIGKGDQNIEIASSSLPPGIYLMHIMNDGKLVEKPFKIIRH
ncbi:MAG: putative Ig domain-containing protein [Pyrinomonadaceae bacterium]|nr:putative Ig domain-containing protein [Sphingobacteriaceae bacterium]